MHQPHPVFIISKQGGEPGGLLNTIGMLLAWFTLSHLRQSVSHVLESTLASADPTVSPRPHSPQGLISASLALYFVQCPWEHSFQPSPDRELYFENILNFIKVHSCLLKRHTERIHIVHPAAKAHAPILSDRSSLTHFPCVQHCSVIFGSSGQGNWQLTSFTLQSMMTVILHRNISTGLTKCVAYLLLCGVTCTHSLIFLNWAKLQKES